MQSTMVSYVIGLRTVGYPPISLSIDEINGKKKRQELKGDG